MIKKIIIYILIIIILILIVFFFILGGGFGNKEKPILSGICNDSLTFFAHRGITEKYPGNSYEALSAAKDLGFCAVEIDLRQTKDNEFVLIHDVDCKRLLDTNVLVSEISYEQLKKISIIYNKKATNNHILKFTDFLNEFKDDFIIYLDVKVDQEKTRFEKADMLAYIIEKYDLYSSAIVANADFLFISYVEYKYPGIMTAIEGFRYDKTWIQDIIPVNFKADFLSGSYKDFSVDEIPYLIENDLLSRRILYHVNSSNIREFMDMGITKFIFDYDSTFKTR
jgi:hypothetical protein